MVMVASDEHWQRRIGRRIRLRDLHVLITVTQCRSMAKAAHRLSVSQPAISKSIGDLEHILGVRLLDRSPRGICSTVYGEALMKRALAAFDELRQAVREIEFIAKPAVGEVRLGCNESLSAAVLPGMIEWLSTRYPGVTVHVTQMIKPITEDIRELRERNLDLIVGRGIFPIAEDDLQSEVLFEEPLLVVAGARSVWARRRQLALADLVGEKWIFYPPSEPPGALIEEAFRAQGLAVPRPRVTTSSFHLRDSLLRTDDYLTVVPACMLRVFNATGKRVKELPVNLGLKPRPVAVFTLKNRTLNPVAQVAIDALRDVTAPMRGSGPPRKAGS
jgi:DNA-binding transcriptional LysR family regulator